MLSWSAHIDSWVNSGLPIHIVRYEDMHQNPFETFNAIFDFFGFHLDERRLNKAIKFSSFKELQKQESEKTFKRKIWQSRKVF